MSAQGKQRLSRRDCLRFGTLGAGVVLLAACQPQIVKETVVVEGAPKVVEKAVTATPQPAKETVNITFRTWSVGAESQSLLDVWNQQQSEVHGTMEEIPWDGFREKILTEIAAGTAAEGTFVDGYWMAEFVEKQLVLGLDDYIAATPLVGRDQYLPLTFSENLQTFGGKTYGMPAQDSPKCIWVNDQVIADAGVKHPKDYEAEDKWDWTTFRELCAQLTKGEGGTKTWAYTTWLGRGDTGDVLYSYGGGWTDPACKEVWTGKPGTAEGLQFILDLYLKDKVCPPEQDSQAQGGSGQMFLTNHLAMYMSGVWEVIWNSQAKDLKYSVVSMPKGPKGRFTFHKPNSLCIVSGAKHHDEVWKVITFMCSPAFEAYLIQCRGTMPFLKANVDLFLQKGCIPNAKIFIDALNNGWAYPLPVNTHGAEMDDLVDAALGQALSEGRDAKWVIAQVEPQLQGLVG